MDFKVIWNLIQIASLEVNRQDYNYLNMCLMGSLGVVRNYLFHVHGRVWRSNLIKNNYKKHEWSNIKDIRMSWSLYD